jgi:hypothetical protein
MTLLGVLPGERHVAKLLFPRWPVGTSAIVRLDGWNRMVTKGYQKGVYERVTKGIRGGRASGYERNRPLLKQFRPLVQMRYGVAMRNCV